MSMVMGFRLWVIVSGIRCNWYLLGLPLLPEPISGRWEVEPGANFGFANGPARFDLVACPDRAIRIGMIAE